MHKRSRHGSSEGEKIIVSEDLYVLKICCGMVSVDIAPILVFFTQYIWSLKSLMSAANPEC